MNHIEGGELIGAKAWDRLVSRYGGSEVAIPGKLDSGSGRRLAELIGDKAAQALIDYAGGDTLYIASNWECTLAARYREVLERRENGESYQEIALNFTYVGRYSERNIRMICAGSGATLMEVLEEHERQLSFDFS